MDQAATQPTQKQQITEVLRSGSNFIVTAGTNPSVDQIAAAVALTLMLRKAGKSAQAVASGNLPRQTDFLPTHVISREVSAMRDFIIDVDTSQTEADKLKYTMEGKQLRIYITPFNGNFSDKNVRFSYGDYHIDGLIALGVSDPKQLTELFSKDKELTAKAKILVINNKAATELTGSTSWTEDASSLSEMVMSMSEALGTGLLDQEVATTLLTGIISATNQFSGANTSPKVMTMAAQLMAAGANQAEIMTHLKKVTAPAAPAAQPAPKPADTEPKIEMKPAQTAALHEDHLSPLMAHQMGAAEPAQPAPTPAAPNIDSTPITPPNPQPAPAVGSLDEARRAIEQAAQSSGDPAQQLEAHYQDPNISPSPQPIDPNQTPPTIPQ